MRGQTVVNIYFTGIPRKRMCIHILAHKRSSVSNEKKASVKLHAYGDIGKAKKIIIMISHHFIENIFYFQTKRSWPHFTLWDKLNVNNLDIKFKYVNSKKIRNKTIVLAQCFGHQT